MKPEIITAYAHLFNFTKPRDNLIDIRDIAHSLSMLCRYIGHCRKFYSIAEHSLRMVNAKLPGNPLVLLLHDASEAYIGDIATPLKQDICYGNNKAPISKLEHDIARRIGNKFHIRITSAEYKEADLRMTATEVRDLMPIGSDLIFADYLRGYEPLEDRILGTLSPEQAEKQFLDKYYELQNL